MTELFDTEIRMRQKTIGNGFSPFYRRDDLRSWLLIDD